MVSYCVIRQNEILFETLTFRLPSSFMSLIRHIPNLLTLLRMTAAPALILCLTDRNYGLGAMLFLVAAVTDALDGWIAKKFDCVTQLGAILDPIADKMLIITAYIVLSLLGDIPLWLVLIVGFRDLGIVGGYLILQIIRTEMPPQPSILSKLNTVAQIAFVLLVMVNRISWVSLSEIVAVVLWLVTITTILSGIHYMYRWFIRSDSTSS